MRIGEPDWLLGREELDSTPSEDSVNYAALHAFIALNMIGLVGMIWMVTTALLSSKVKRLSTWYSFCASWILSCSSYLLLFFAGEQYSLTPNFWLCYVQTALIYAMPPTETCTTLAFLVHILLCFSDSDNDSEAPIQVTALTSFFLLTGPYIVFVVVFLGVALFEIRNPSTLEKADWGTYCHSNDYDWSRVSYIVVAVVSVAIILVQGQLAIRLCSRRYLRRGSHQYSTIFRGILFTLIGFITLVSAMVLTITHTHNMTFDIIISSFPVLALIVFGSQRDLLLSWAFWRHPLLSEKAMSLKVSGRFSNLS